MVANNLREQASLLALERPSCAAAPYAIFSSLQKRGLLEVRQKRIVILDAQGLERRLAQ